MTSNYAQIHDQIILNFIGHTTFENFSHEDNIIKILFA